MVAATVPAGAQPAASGSAPGAALRQQLSDLAANPQSVEQLIATGRAALAMGDGEGALSFFTRAEQLAARDARVKAGLAAAHTRLGRPETALPLFAEAVTLGAPAAELAGDRGLAYDMVGQTARAQQDYLVSLRLRDDAEIRRRLALSLAISGQREAALRLIEPQLAGGDRGAQRARIMILALSGDARGAGAAASQALPAQAAQSLSPFLARLASLAPGEMAAAANLGRVPNAGGIRQASARGEADPAALAFAGGGAPVAAARLPVALADANPRRRPGGVTGAAAVPRAERGLSNAAALDAGRPRGGWTEASSRVSARPSTPVLTETAGVTGTAAPLRLPHPNEPLRVNSAALETTRLAGGTPAGPRIPSASLSETPTAPVAVPPATRAPVQLAAASVQPPTGPVASDGPPANVAEEPAEEPTSTLAIWNGAAAPARETGAPTPARNPAATPVRTLRPAVTPTATPRAAQTPPATTPRRNFSDVAASVSSLPRETATSSPTPRPAATSRNVARAPAATAPTRTTAGTTTTANRRTQTAAATTSTRSANTRPGNPARIWVQLGVSPNRDGFGYEMTRMRRLVPELARQTAHTAPIGSSHRLLVGPFPTDAAARAFVNTLRQKDIQSMAWTSTAGTAVERLPAGR